jgi:hypothetical protein
MSIATIVLFQRVFCFLGRNHDIIGIYYGLGIGTVGAWIPGVSFYGIFSLLRLQDREGRLVGVFFRSSLAQTLSWAPLLFLFLCSSLSLA